MIDITEEDLIGRLLYDPTNDLFCEIVCFDEPFEFVEEYGRSMTIRRWPDGFENCANWKQDIGEEFRLVSAEFPKDLAIAYCELSESIRAQRNQMMNIFCHHAIEFVDGGADVSN